MANSHLPSKADNPSTHSHTVQRLINASLALLVSVSHMVFSEISKASVLSVLRCQLNKADVINPFYILITSSVIAVCFKTNQTIQKAFFLWVFFLKRREFEEQTIAIWTIISHVC